MEVAEWLLEGLASSSLTGEARDYLHGRGATDAVIEEWGIKVWDPPLTECPDVRLHEHYGKYFERFEGKVLYPLCCPKGKFLGFDSRHIERKDDVRFLLPESRWVPIWIGMPSAMEQIWKGLDVIVVEGRFDVFALLQAMGAAGVNKAVLGSGPAHLSWKQVEFLGRWCTPVPQSNHSRVPHVYMAYDNDPPGKKGVTDGLKHLSRRGVSCSHLRYGNPLDDPGLIWDRGGVEALREAFRHL